jgi:hypothetical protein
MKIGILIPCTSNGRAWETMEESYLFRHTITTFLKTMDHEHEYTFYIGVDRGDGIYDNPMEFNKINVLVLGNPNISIHKMYMDDVEKGYLTKMWNILFKRAYDDGCDYFFQCGDDITFKTKGWVNESIFALHKSNNVGMTGPVNNNARILTQTFVSRKHMEIFGFYFTEDLINWYCDDWINGVYKKADKFFPLLNQLCENLGGIPRYSINNDPFFTSQFEKKKKILGKRCDALVEIYYKRLFL